MNTKNSMPASVPQWVERLLKKSPKPRKWWLAVILPIYLLGVLSAILRGNVVIHDVLDATRDKFIALKCDQAGFMEKAKLNTETRGALLWRTDPVTTVTTAILDNPQCLSAMLASMPNYPRRYEIVVYDGETGKTVLRVVKE